MTPFFFGSSKKPLFGIYTPPLARPASPRPKGAVLICNPFGREYLRAHRALRELADRLAQEGHHSLRFDYYGCGDSAGEAEEGDVAQWVDDVGVAATELVENAATPEISGVGLRLGAALCLLAAERGSRFSRLVLWDPVVVGASYIDELRRLQAAWAEVHPAPKAAVVQVADEVLGFPLAPPLEEAIAAIDLRRLARPPAEKVLLLTSGEADDEVAALSEALERLGVDVARRAMPGAKFWLKQDGIDDAVVPSDAVRAIASWFGEVAA